MNADTDDDGLSDGFELGRAAFEKFPFFNARIVLDPLKPDSDGDGLPDGLELGVQKDAKGCPLTLAGTNDHEKTVSLNPYSDSRYTDIDATFTYAPAGGAPEVRKCFIASPDPNIITDPGHRDTNFDGDDDGKYVTYNIDGTVD
jgi:hypothetical protein